MVTGTTKSRLIELRKYKINGGLSDIYITGGNVNTDGINTTESTNNNIVYFLGTIRYNDIVDVSGNTSTTFSFEPDGLNNPNFITRYIYKDPNKEKIISQPKIDNDVFIKRQQISAFEQNYRLEFIDKLVDLETYAGGNYFNIVKNN